MMAARKRPGFSRFWLLAALPHLLSAQTLLTLVDIAQPVEIRRSGRLDRHGDTLHRHRPCHVL